MPDQPSLAGPIARIDRADELLQQLDAELNAFLRSSPYEVEEIPDLDEQTRAFVLRNPLTVFQSCRLQRLDAVAYLTATMLALIAGDVDPLTLTPAVYAESRRVSA